MEADGVESAELGGEPKLKEGGEAVVGDTEPKENEKEVSVRVGAPRAMVGDGEEDALSSSPTLNLKADASTIILVAVGCSAWGFFSAS